jgi:hypothetical protein
MAKKAGFPYLSEIEIMGDETLHGQLQPGTGIVEQPLFEFAYDPQCSIIGQVIFTQDIDPSQSIDFEGKQYVQDHLLEGNRLCPILQKGDALSWYPHSPSKNWIPNREHNLNGLITQNAIQTLKIQNYLIQRIPIAKDVSEERTTYMKTEFANCVEANNSFISIIRNDQWKI